MGVVGVEDACVFRRRVRVTDHWRLVDGQHQDSPGCRGPNRSRSGPLLPLPLPPPPPPLLLLLPAPAAAASTAAAIAARVVASSGCAGGLRPHIRRGGGFLETSIHGGASFSYRCSDQAIGLINQGHMYEIDIGFCLDCETPQFSS